MEEISFTRTFLSPSELPNVLDTSAVLTQETIAYFSIKSLFISRGT